MKIALKVASLACVAVFAQSALAVAAEWHWDAFGSSKYGGQVSLKDDQGSAVNYQRYSAGASPALFGAISVQSPLLVVAGGADIKFDIVQSGTVIAKPVCNLPETPHVYVTPVTVCNFGQGNAIAGINAWADQTATTYTPRVAGWFQGYGWRPLDGTACGRVEVKTLCSL